MNTAIRTANSIFFALMLATGGATQAGIQKWEIAVHAAHPLHWYKFDESTGSNCLDYGREGLNGIYGSMMAYR